MSDILGGEQRHVPKPWGSEQIWALTERYCGKVIRISAGKRLSLQRHERKEESLIVMRGTLRLHLEDDEGIVRVLRCPSRTGERGGRGRCSPAAARESDLEGEAIARTVALDTNDGFKFFLADGTWLLIRASGTEPLVRVYTEATSPELRDELVVTGEQLVRGR